MKRNFRKLKKEIKEEFIIYLAGMLDRTGLFWMRKQPVKKGLPVFRCLICIQSQDKKVIDYINRELFEGDSSIQIHKPFGKEIYKIEITGPTLDALLIPLRNHMITKKDHIGLMIKMRESIIAVKNNPKHKKQLPHDIIEYREDLVKEMNKLNAFPHLPE